MGLVESTLKAQTVRSIVRPDSITPLPSVALDSCSFTDGSVGFLITTVDLAKNTQCHVVPLKEVYSPYENTYIYAGKDESVLTFNKDRRTGRVFCTVHKNGANTVILRQCVTTYEPLGNEQIDYIGNLYTAKCLT
jgi:hypothetical protein